MSAHSSAVSSTVSPSSSIALVTGATGFVAVHVIQQLLSKDYTVRGTVRSIKDAKAVDLVHDFPSLSLFEADLMQPTSFDQAIDGARFIFHIASPAMLTADDAQRSIIDPAVNGTATVVSAALRTPSVERIIVTSSIATFLDPSSPAGRVYTESDWNLHWPAEHAPYQLSKVLAEQKAWDLVNAHNAQPDQRHPVRLITILPSTVLGPPIGRRIDGFSVSIITDLLNGSQVEGGVFPSNFPDVDVRDVATAHIVAAELKGANGRYIVSGPHPATHLDYVELLKPCFPKRAMPSKAQGPWFFRDYTLDNSRSIQELGIRYIDQKESIQDMLDRLIDIGLVTKD